MMRIRRTAAGDLQVKRDAIKAYFDELEERAQFAEQLCDDGRVNEAMTLCCCYIDGLAQFLYHDSDKSAFNFVRILREHSEQAEFAQLCPLALTRWAEASHPKLAPVARKLASALGADVNRIMAPDQLSSAMTASLPPQHVAALSREVWRASLAYVAYTHLRVPAVHATGTPGAVIIGSGGPSQPVRLDFRLVYRALLACITTLRGLSLQTNKWFGHDQVF
jgi:hypothetical protein